MSYKQINSICISAFFHLRNIGSVRNMLTDDACSQLIHALVTVRIDLTIATPSYIWYAWFYFVSIAKGFKPCCSYSKKTPKCSQFTDSFKDLHWLPIRQRIQKYISKILLLTYQAYHNTYTAPSFFMWIDYHLL